MDEEVESLTYDYNYNIFLTRTLLPNLPALKDRENVVMWLKKLTSCTRTIEEMKVRNDILFHLVSELKKGVLGAPFSESPPPGSLHHLANLLSSEVERSRDNAQFTQWANTSMGKDQQPPLLYQNSPDGGSFLAAQPIPRCGAFCYLAVVSRDSPKQSDLKEK